MRTSLLTLQNIDSSFKARLIQFRFKKQLENMNTKAIRVWPVRKPW